MFKKSNNPRVAELNKTVTERAFNLSCLQAVKLTELNKNGKPKRLCAWCCETELRDSRQKYCTKLCSDSAMAWAYPQKEDALKFLLLQQDFKCNSCQFDYRPAMEAVKGRMRHHTPTADVDLPWYYFKSLKGKLEKARRPEVDHIIPIYKGGQSLGLDNHQAICYTCHKTKTKVDLGGKRVKKDVKRNDSDAPVTPHDDGASDV